MSQARCRRRARRCAGGEEVAAGKVAHQSLVDRRSVEGKVGDILGQGQLGDGDLVLDRARLLLEISAVSRSPTTRCGSCWRFTAVAMISSKAAFMP